MTGAAMRRVCAVDVPGALLRVPAHDRDSSEVKPAIQPDGGQGLAKRTVVARRGLKEA